MESLSSLCYDQIGSYSTLFSWGQVWVRHKWVMLNSYSKRSCCTPDWSMFCCALPCWWELKKEKERNVVAHLLPIARKNPGKEGYISLTFPSHEFKIVQFFLIKLISTGGFSLVFVNIFNLHKQKPAIEIERIVKEKCCKYLLNFVEFIFPSKNLWKYSTWHKGCVVVYLNAPCFSSSP